MSLWIILKEVAQKLVKLKLKTNGNKKGALRKRNAPQESNNTTKAEEAEVVLQK